MKEKIIKGGFNLFREFDGWVWVNELPGYPGK